MPTQIMARRRSDGSEVVSTFQEYGREGTRPPERHTAVATLALAALLMAAIVTSAIADPYSQAFDTWPYTGDSGSILFPIFTNTTHESWVINDTSVGAPSDTLPFAWHPEPASPPRAAWLNALNQGGVPWVKSPLLTNGISEISLLMKTTQGSGTQGLALETSINDVEWVVRSTFAATSSQTWTHHQVPLDFDGMVRVRFRKTADDGESSYWLGIDDIVIMPHREPATITNLVLSPSRPTTEDSVDVSVSIQAPMSATNVGARLFYRTASAAPFTPILMSSTGSGHYATIDGIPAQTVPHIIVQYYVEVSFTDSAGMGTNYYPDAGADNPAGYRVMPVTVCTNMDVVGSESVAMRPVRDHEWHATLSATGVLDHPVFLFSATNTWGDSEQTVSNPPVFGVAQMGGANIAVSGSVSGHLFFSFCDTGLAYTVQRAEHASFGDWGSGATNYGSYTNDEGWVLVNGRVAGGTEGELIQAFDEEYATLRYSPGVEQYIRSPFMPDGLGRIAFWYRNSELDGSQAAAFAVQKSVDGESGWQTVAEVSNIFAFGYLYFEAPIADRSSHHVRVLNRTGSANALLHIDEVTVTEPVSTVELLSPGRNPVNPLLGEYVSVSIDAVAYGNATGLACAVFYRHGDNGTVVSSPLTRSGDTFLGTIPPMVAGPVQYYFSCSYSGAESTPSRFPVSGPWLSYTNASVAGSNRNQPFDTWPYTGDDGTFLHLPIFPTTTNEGWIAAAASVAASSDYPIFNWHPPPLSPPRAAWFQPLSEGGNPFLTSPLISNGISVAYFAARCMKDGPQQVSIESSPSGIDGTWASNGIVTINSHTWVTNIVPLAIREPAYIRIHKVDDLDIGGQWLGLDNVQLSFPPSDVTIADVQHSPSYPAAGRPVTVSCVVTAAFSSVFPPVAIEPLVYYRSGTEPWQSLPMTPAGGDVYAGVIPAFPSGGLVSYYIQCGFEGYYHSYGATNENQSPAFAPEAPHWAERPDTFYSYNVRAFASPYSGVVATGNIGQAEFTMIADDVWQTVLPGSITNLSHFALVGLDRRQANTDVPITDVWGDLDQSRYGAPILGEVTSGGTNVALRMQADEQYLVRVDLNAMQYLISRCEWQDFDTWALHTELFAAGAEGVELDAWSQDFDAWPVSTDREETVTFDEPGWTNYPGYPDWHLGETYEGDWAASSFRPVHLPEGRCDLYPEANRGHIRTTLGGAEDLNGIGHVSLNYRATETGSYVTVLGGASTWDNYTVESQIDSSGDNKDNGTYHSLFYYYQNETNYYEARLTQTNDGGSLFMSIHKRTPSSFVRLRRSSIFSGTLEGSASWKIVVTNLPTGRSRVYGYFNNSTKIANLQDSTGPLTSGTVGFNSYDINMAVDAIEVRRPGETYQELFSSATATGWQTNTAWKISGGRYRREGRASDPLAFRIATCPTNLAPLEPANWTIQEVSSNLLALSYVSLSVPIRQPESAYVIIDHTFGDGSLRVDDVTVQGWRGETVEYQGWLAADGWVTESGYEGRGLELRSSRSPDSADHMQYLKSPLLSSVGNIGFLYKTPEGCPPADVEIQWASEYTPNDWISIRAATLEAPESWTQYACCVNVSSSGYLRIAHTSIADDARLLLDSVRIYDYRAENTNAWTAYNALITPNRTNRLFRGEGQSCYLNNSFDADIFPELPYTNSSPYIQTPQLRDPIGEISLWCQEWNMGHDGAKLRIEGSPDGSAGSWQPLMATNVDNQVFGLLTHTLLDAQSRFVRFSNVVTSDIPDRLCLDEILVVPPLAADLVLTNLVFAPPEPTYTNSVHVFVDVTDVFLSVSNVAPVTYYATATNPSSWSGPIAVPMVLVASNPVPYSLTYRSETPIPAHDAGTYVQLQVRCDFTGQNSVVTSPKLLPEEGSRKPYYRVRGGEAVVRGMKWFDGNTNGNRDAGDVGLDGWSIELQDCESGHIVARTTTTNIDLNTNGVIDPEREQGLYSFERVAPGEYTVTEILQPGWSQSFPASGAYSISVPLDGGTFTNVDFGNWQLSPGTICGAKWHDLNTNALWDAGEPGVSNWTVYIDQDGDHRLGAAELSAKTGADGLYCISNIPPGNITVAEETRDGWTRVFPSSGTELIVNGGFETGDANGWQALGSLAVCDATFGSGPVAGQYQACLATGPGSVPVADLEVFLGLADGAISSQGEGLVVEGSAIKQQIVVQAGAVLSGTWNFLTDESESAYAMNDFAVLAIAPAAPELLAVAGDAIWPSPTAFFSETGAMSFSHVFARGGVYSVGLAVVDVGDALVDSALTLDAVHVQASPGAHVVALAPDATETNVNFGNVAVVPAEVHGRKWHDLNGDGQRDAEEPGLPDWTIYLDLNANAQLDGGEPFGVSGLDGSYAIEGLLPGTYRIEEVVHPPWKQTYPAAARFLTLTPAASVENVDFANALAGSISGKKWHDLDGDGEWDAAEPALADWIFYVDENLNGWRDSGEPFTLTDGDGNYALTNLNMGQNRVGEVLPSDWIQTAGGTGTGLVEFEEGTVAFATDPNAISVELTDVDGDLVADLVLLCSGPDTLKIAVNNGLGGFSSTVSFSVTGTARASATGDVDGDGDSDVVVATGDPAGVAVLANSDGYFTAVAEYDTGLLDSLYLVDLDWDGDLDLIGAGYGSDSVSVLRNDGVGRFQLPSTDYHVGNGPGCVGAGDLDGDGDQDVVLANDLDHTVSVLLNDGLGTLGNALSYAAGLNPFRLQLSDADGDGDLDIVVANRTADTVGVLLNGGDATFSAPLTYPVGVMPNGLVVADLDMDGVDDIVTADRDSDTLSLYGNTVTGLYLLAQISVDDMPVALAAGDVDGDGDRDLAVVHSGALDVSVLYNRFRSNFAEHNLESGAVVAGVDFGNSRLASIRGTVWHDLNGDGQRQEEDYGLRGWTVFMDSNNNGRFDLAEQTAWTDHTGAYVFTSLKPSDCTVRVTAREGWAPTYPTNPGYPLTLMSGETIQDVDFAYHGEPPLIFGSVWHDNDGNGSWDDGEPALAGWTVYDDVNTNALLDSAEQFATTDIAGNYALSNLVPGGHFVVQVLKPVWMQTYAGSANTMFLSELVAYDQISSPHGLEFDFTQALAPTGDGELVVYAKGDFGSSYEDLNVTAEGVSLANLFVLGGADCSMVTATVDIPGNTLADLAQDGVISFTVRFSHYVDDECSDPVLGLRLSYPAEGAPLQVGWGQELRVDFGNLLTNLPPLILSNSPHAYALAIPEATNSAFAAYATDPEGSNISYSWRWADTPVGVDSNTFTRETDWGDAGAYELRVTVSDGVWTNIWTNWSVTVLGDNDSDGMSNWWENLYGLDPFVNDALLDRDEDGFINLWEQLAGTIPTNPHSSLEITNVVAVSGNDVLVRWLSVSNRFYRLESASNLIHGFSCIESNIPATPAVNTYTDDVGSVMFRFYRIMLEQ